MAALIQHKDWAATPLGPIDQWPQSLRTTVSLCLASNFPINIIWGPENTQIYNDGYKVVCGEAHPRALGEGYHITWASAWPAIGEPFERALAGHTSFLENQRMFLARNGYLEETFFTFSTSPIRDESGGIGGLFHPVTETTTTILAERRTRALRDLTARLGGAADIPALIELTVETLADFAFDIPFLLFYEHEPQTQGFRLVRHSGVAADCPAIARRVDAHSQHPWPLSAALAHKGSLQVDDIATLFAETNCGPYPEPPAAAFVLAVIPSGDAGASLMIVAGASPRLPLNDVYRGFYELLGAAVSAAMATVLVRTQERERAEALAAIDQAKTLFFTNISHEFRTPLTLMLGPLEQSLALAEQLPADEVERVRLAYRNGQRLLKLVNSLLEFSRIEAGRAQARYVPVDLVTLTTDLASSFRSACERAGLELIIETTPLPDTAWVDRDMWEKIILNLVSNAFKFTMAGHIRITVNASEDGRQARVAVEDTGVGIAARELPRLFERFHRVEGVKGRSFEGSGIGLAMVQELVRLHQGTLEVSSEVGHGSTFVVSLPLGRALAPVSVQGAEVFPASTAAVAEAFVEEALSWLPETVTSEAESEALPGVARGRVLLADDNADMRAYITRLLRAQGLTVETAMDGEMALAAARRRKPDLILTDVMMPALDGFGLLRAVREDPALQTVPVVLLSARAGEEARVEGLSAGADDYLIKPFSARELLSRVTSHLERARDRRIATLRDSEARLRLAVEAGQIGEWELEVETDTSVRALRHDQILGYEKPVAQWGFQTFLEHVLPEDRDAVEASYRQANAQGTGWNIQCRIRRANDQAIRWVLIRSTPLTNKQGQAVRIFGLLQDITEQKQLEIGLQELNDTLERRIAEAIEERSKAEEHLRQAQKLEALGQLTGGVAHDFNNLLTVIRSSVDLLARPNLSDERRVRYVTAISETVNRAARLTAQLLAFARRQSLKPEAFNVGQAIAALVDMLDTLTDSRIQITTAIHGQPCYVNADPSQFDTAMVNLAMNARDAMCGEGRLSLSVYPVDEIPAVRAHPAVPGEFIAIAVTDTGAGIAPEHLERIFEPFFTTKGVGMGTGLGLSQVFGFAKQSGGEVRVITEVGRGSTLTLYLARVAGASLVRDAEPAPLPEGHGTRVLVVEDNADVGAFTVQTLTELGYQTRWALNAEEALQALQAAGGGFDVVFSDVMMPGLDGVELAREIRRRHAGLPVVLTSGYSHVIARHGTHGFELLHKPYSIDQLSHVLRKAIVQGVRFS
ncbi:response regulator [Pseudomonas ovata]|uniref:response regulator n=1 Tax=Pseudomonas ovata TaxID=1839709 RepID=UPI001F4EC316|nr:response regulator [Pseudomonas ovata]